MNTGDQSEAVTFGLFEKRIEGDNSLMELSRLRFAQSGLAPEMYAGSPEHLEWAMNFRPTSDVPVMVHMPRDCNLADEQGRNKILDFASRFAGRVRGLVIHDHAAMAMRTQEYITAAWKLDDQLERIHRCPMLFVEYAVGVDLAAFVRFFSAIPDLDLISACIDIGHVGIHEAREAYARTHAGEDIYALKFESARLPHVMADVDTAVSLGATATLNLVSLIAALNKPVHFHLHDAHPLSTVSPFGVSDHLSFFAEIPLDFDHGGGRTAAPMFGPAGLSKLVSHAIEQLGTSRVSFTLEIHPTGERLPLDDAAQLFAHWSDKTNAERMNHWLSVLSRNHTLLQQAIQASLPSNTSQLAQIRP